jgi:hypothetical protein
MATDQGRYRLAAIKHEGGATALARVVEVEEVAMSSASEFLGAKQFLCEQNGDRVARLEYHGERRADRTQRLIWVIRPQTDDAHRFQHRRGCPPIGNCQGFPSPKSPRMLTSADSGNRPPLVSDSMLMQLPTPLLCSSKTPRAPPRSAPASNATPSSVVKATE